MFIYFFFHFLFVSSNNYFIAEASLYFFLINLTGIEVETNKRKFIFEFEKKIYKIKEIATQIRKTKLKFISYKIILFQTKQIRHQILQDDKKTEFN